MSVFFSQAFLLAGYLVFYPPPAPSLPSPVHPPDEAKKSSHTELLKCCPLFINLVRPVNQPASQSKNSQDLQGQNNVYFLDRKVAEMTVVRPSSLISEGPRCYRVTPFPVHVLFFKQVVYMMYNVILLSLLLTTNNYDQVICQTGQYLYLDLLIRWTLKMIRMLKAMQGFELCPP